MANWIKTEMLLPARGELVQASYGKDIREIPDSKTMLLRYSGTGGSGKWTLPDGRLCVLAPTFWKRWEMPVINLEAATAFYEWLQGKDNAPCLEAKSQPHLTDEQAFSVIYYLQEVLHVFPDTYERCPECGELYDSDVEDCCRDFDEEDEEEDE